LWYARGSDVAHDMDVGVHGAGARTDLADWDRGGAWRLISVCRVVVRRGWMRWVCFALRRDDGLDASVLQRGVGWGSATLVSARGTRRFDTRWVFSRSP
jgi:hypothetical protein